MQLWFQNSWDDPVGKSAGCSTVLRARNNPFICLLFIDGWCYSHVPVRKMLSICLYAEFLSFRFACSELVVVWFKRDFTTSGWLVLFSLEVIIIKRSHLIVSATVFLPVSLSCARRNNLQYKDENRKLTLITFYQVRKCTYITDVGIEMLHSKLRIYVDYKLSLFMPHQLFCTQFKRCLQSLWQTAIKGNRWPITTWQVGKGRVPVFTPLTWGLSDATMGSQC